MTLEPTITRDRLIPQPDGSFTVRYTQNVDEGVMSIQRDGSIGWRTPGTAGPWECGRIKGNRLEFRDSAYPFGAYSFLLSDE